MCGIQIWAVFFAPNTSYWESFTACLLSACPKTAEYLGFFLLFRSSILSSSLLCVLIYNHVFLQSMDKSRAHVNNRHFRFFNYELFLRAFFFAFFFKRRIRSIDEKLGCFCLALSSALKCRICGPVNEAAAVKYEESPCCARWTWAFPKKKKWFALS